MSEAVYSQPKHRFFSISRVNAIAWNTFTELVRLKVFNFLLIFALLVIGNSAFMVQFSFQEEFQVLKDVSLGAMSIFTSLLAMVATAMLLPKDIEDRTLYTILAKPVPRFEYLLGKLGGVLFLLAIATLLMSVVFALVLYIREQWVIGALTRDLGAVSPEALAERVAQVKEATFNTGLLFGVAVIYMKAALLASLALFVSTFATSSIFTIIVSVAVYFIGHLQATARDYWLTETGSTLTRLFVGIVSLVFPDLQMFNLVDDIVAGTVIATSLFLKTLGLGALYVVVYWFLAYVVFAYKEF